MSKLKVTNMVLTFVFVFISNTIVQAGVESQTYSNATKSHNIQLAYNGSGDHGHRSKKRNKHKRGAGFRKMLKHLDLSDEQRAKVKEIHKAAKPEIKVLMKSMKESKKQLAALTESDEYDQSSVNEIAKKQANAMSEITIIKAKTHNDIYMTLTTEQKEKLKALKEKRKLRRTERKARKG